MKIELGVKSDPIQYRYPFSWLFEIMQRNEIRRMQLGSFFELYSLPNAYFSELRQEAASYGIRISSVFTAHRELGGFLSGNSYMEKAARTNYERLIEAAALLGADYVGSNPGAVFRNRMEAKERGVETYLTHMEELMEYAAELGVKGLTIEPMSCLAEPPTLPEEMDYMVSRLSRHHRNKPDSTVPVYLCGDISHGYANADRNVVRSNLELFTAAIPSMCEFHIKNTDEIFNSTFGFSPDEIERGIVDLNGLYNLIQENSGRFPVNEIVGYLEIGGPKHGRDYSDFLLEEQLESSLRSIRKTFLAAQYV